MQSVSEPLEDNCIKHRPIGTLTLLLRPLFAVPALSSYATVKLYWVRGIEPLTCPTDERCYHYTIPNLVVGRGIEPHNPEIEWPFAFQVSPGRIEELTGPLLSAFASNHCLAIPAGLEPATSRVTGGCSNQLSYDTNINR